MSTVSRRRLLASLVSGVGTLGLANVLRLRAASGKPVAQRDTSLIFLWQDGGPTQFETFDPKPDAPLEYRGELGSIATALPGVRFCETLPRLAALADRLTIVRSLHQPFADHWEGCRNFLTGYAEAEPGNVSSYPDVGTVIGRVRSGRQARLPRYVSLGANGHYGLTRVGPGYLGTSYKPFVVGGDPAAPDFRVDQFVRHEANSLKRLEERHNLLRGLDRLAAASLTSQQGEALDRFQQQALDLLSSPQAARAFDLTREPARIRERYGLHTAGQQLLLARRLVEAGVSVVGIRFSPDGRGDGDKSAAGWDDHAEVGNIFKIMQRRGPQFDQAIATLVEDLGERGLDRHVLVVVAGEFGRTPKISYTHDKSFNMGYSPGRDHWASSASALLFGGGMSMGQVIGATNRLGEYPVERPLQPQDLLATIYRFMGIDPQREFVNRAGRPVRVLPFGSPIAELNG